MSVLFRHQTIDAKGVVSGAMVHFRKGRAPGVVFTDRAMQVPAKNPLPADSLGRVVAYLPEGEEFEITVTRKDGTFVEQFDSTAVTGSDTHIIEQPPEVITVTKEVDSPETLQRITNLERAIQEQRARAEAAESRLAEKSYEEGEEPPEGLADLFDPELTARQNQEALQKRYAALMSERELHLGGGDTSKAMELLKRAERIESGITWNRARLAEVL